MPEAYDPLQNLHRIGSVRTQFRIALGQPGMSNHTTDSTDRNDLSAGSLLADLGWLRANLTGSPALRPAKTSSRTPARSLCSSRRRRTRRARG